MADDRLLAFHFLPLSESDLPLLQAWLQRPHVAQWWGEPESIDELREDFLSGGTTRAYLAHQAGVPVGFVQCYVVMGSGEGWWPPPAASVFCSRSTRSAAPS